MSQRLLVIDSIEELKLLQLYLQDKEYVAYDSETTGLSRDSQVVGFSVCAEEDLAYYVILQTFSKTEGLQPKSYLLEARDLLLSLRTKQLIMHNAIYDCIMSEAYFKIKLIDRVHTDTMILAHLLDENRPAGLKELSKRFFGEDAAQEQEEMKASVLSNDGEWSVKNKEMYKADSCVLGKYGAKDALLTFKLFHALLPELYDQGLDKFFYEEESMPLLRGPTFDLNYTGLQVDTKALTSLKKALEAECAEAQAFICQETAPYVKEKYPGDKKKCTFNINSNAQLSWLLFGVLQLEFATLTKEGKNVCKALGLRLPYNRGAKNQFIAECLRRVGEVYQHELRTKTKTVRSKKVKEPWTYIECGKKVLSKLAPKYKWIGKLLEYKKKEKLLNTYVYGIEERMQYGTIYPSFLQHGTTSGRYSSRDPNFQNLPRDDKRIKACIVARPRKKFVGADYSQLEPRVFAFFSGDERLLSAFTGEDDFYSVIGMAVYGKQDCTPRKEGSPEAFGIKYKKLRDLSKVIALASTYGATAHQLAPTTGKSIEDTQLDIDEYFERFPKVKQFQLDSHLQVKRTGVVTNLFDRPRRIPDAKGIPESIRHTELPYEARNMLNLAVNHRVQSTGASIVNRAAIAFKAFCEKVDIQCKIVVQVHDSLVIECDENDAEDVTKLLQHAMQNTVILQGVKLEAVPKIGTDLSKV